MWAIHDAVTVEEINAAPKDTLQRAQTVFTYFLTVCGLLLVVFVEPSSRFWATREERSGHRRQTWLTIALLVGVLVIAFVPDLSGLFHLPRIDPLDMAVVGLAAAEWEFLVRSARNRRSLERFPGTNPAR